MTVKVKLWVASGEIPLVALTEIGYVPAVPAAGVPDSVAVPLPLSVKLTPLGSVPVFDSDGAGVPVVVNEKLPACPVVNVVLDPLVIAGA